MKNAKKEAWIKRLLATALAVAMAVPLLSADILTTEVEAATTLARPKIVTDSGMKSNQKVTWDCIWFGSYPQAEVITSEMSKDYTSVHSSYFNEDKDIVVSNRIYNALQNASGWVNNDITLDGVKYRRMIKYDATNYFVTSDNYYRWADTVTYHYFKYEPIKWRVLSVSGNLALIISDVALDDLGYHKKDKAVSWETSTIRSWLNGYTASENQEYIDYSIDQNFVDSAFNALEQSAIVSTEVVNENNGTTSAGNDTQDKIFLLSLSEACNISYGFADSSTIYDEARRCKSSTYAKARGINTYTTAESIDADCIGCCDWWLRSPGTNTAFASGCRYFGRLLVSGGSVTSLAHGVRPVLTLDVSKFDLSNSDVYSYAGTVCSDGTVNEQGNTSTREVDAFDLTLYQARILSDWMVVPSTEWEEEVVEDDRISDKLISALETGSTGLSAKAWTALQGKLASQDGTSNLTDFTLEERDLYEALLYTILSDTSANAYAGKEKEIELNTSDIMKEFERYEILSSVLQSGPDAAWDDIPEVGKETVLEILEAYYGTERLKKLSGYRDNIKKLMAAVQNIEEGIRVVNTYILLYEINDAFHQVVRTLCEQCPESESGLRSALKECYSVMSGSNDAFITDMVNGTVQIAGESVISYWSSVYWENVKTRLIMANSNLEIPIAAYKSGKYVSGVLFHTDETAEKYFHMIAVNALSQVAKDTYHLLATQYKNVETLENAQIYLSVADIMYRCIDADCRYGSIYVSELDESAVKKLQPIFDELTIADTVEVIEWTWRYYRQVYDTVLLDWTSYLEEDGYEEEFLKYESILGQEKQNLVKMYQIASAVNVFVYDEEGKLAASVLAHTPGIYTEGITAVVQDDVKYLYFTNVCDSYEIRYVGTDEGAMDVTIYEYENETIARTIRFQQLELTEGKTYLSDYNAGILAEDGYIMNQAGQEIYPDYDSVQSEKLGKHQITIENGIMMNNDTPALELQAGKGEKIKISVYYIPEGYEFSGWTVSDETAVIEDSAAPVTYLYVGSADCEVCAELCEAVTKEPDEPVQPPSDEQEKDNPESGGNSTAPGTSVSTGSSASAGGAAFSGNPTSTRSPVSTGSSSPASGQSFGSVSVPKAGKKLTDRKTKAVYTVVKAGAAVAYAGTTNKKATSITIPSTVKIGNITYKVTSVAKNALKNNKKLKKVTISGNVTAIGANAFYGCTALKTVKIGSKVTTIGKKAFYNCKKLTALTIQSKKLTAKKIGSKAFTKAGSSNYKKLKVKVPSSKYAVYKKALKKKGLSTKVKVVK